MDSHATTSKGRISVYLSIMLNFPFSPTGLQMSCRVKLCWLQCQKPREIKWHCWCILQHHQLHYRGRDHWNSCSHQGGGVWCGRGSIDPGRHNNGVHAVHPSVNECLCQLLHVPGGDGEGFWEDWLYPSCCCAICNGIHR